MVRAGTAVGTVATGAAVGTAAIPIPVLGTLVGLAGGVAAALKVDKAIAGTFQRRAEASALRQAASTAGKTPTQQPKPPAQAQSGQAQGAPAPTTPASAQTGPGQPQPKPPAQGQSGQAQGAPAPTTPAAVQTDPGQPQTQGKDDDPDKPKDKTALDSLQGSVEHMAENYKGYLIAAAVLLMVGGPLVLALGAAAMVGGKIVKDKADNAVAKMEYAKKHPSPTASPTKSPDTSQSQAQSPTKTAPQDPSIAPAAPIKSVTVSAPTITPSMEGRAVRASVIKSQAEGGPGRGTSNAPRVLSAPPTRAKQASTPQKGASRQ